MMNLAVTGALDSHRGTVFLADPDGQRGPVCPDVFFCRFPHGFCDFCEGFCCFRRSFGPRPARGPKTPKGTSPPPDYVPDQASKSGRMSTLPRQPDFRN